MPILNLNNIENKKIIDEENIIIGSGAGGSTIAFELLKKGKKSIILEEGPNINNLFNSNVGSNIVNLYRNNGATPMISSNGGPLIGYGQGSCVGGSTYVNAGYFSSTPEWIFEKWTKDNKTILNFNEYQNLIKEIRNEIQISTETLNFKDGDSKFLFKNSNNLNWKIKKCERFSNGKQGDEKHNMNNTYHKNILKSGCKIIHGCRVDTITTKNGRAIGLTAMSNSKKKYYFRFKNLFVNCGPINTPYLLKKNNLIENNNNNFEFHINFKIIVKFKNEINFNNNTKFDPNSPLSIFFMREFEKDGILLSSANSELPYILATSSHFNDQIKKDIYLNFSKYCMYVYQIKSKSKGSIKNYLNNPFVKYKFEDQDYEEIKKAIKRLSKFFLQSDVEFILYPIENSSPISTLTQSNLLIDSFNPKKLHLISVHGMSSLRSGTDNCETDFFGKLKKFENIFINDASILPGNTGESPQATVMAYAKYVGKNCFK